MAPPGSPSLREPLVFFWLCSEGRAAGRGYLRAPSGRADSVDSSGEKVLKVRGTDPNFKMLPLLTRLAARRRLPSRNEPFLLPRSSTVTAAPATRMRA